MIKAIIFDLNGVFIVSPKLSERMEADFNVPIEEFLEALKQNMDKVRRPGAIDMGLWQPYFDKWGLNFSEQEFYDYWFSEEKENKKLVDLAKKLKAKDIKLFILSNNFQRRAEYYDKTFPFLNEVFDKIYYSWQTGFVKPDIRALNNILEDNNLSPKSIIYFDDSEKNIDLAKSLGIEAHIFDNKAVELLESLIGA